MMIVGITGGIGTGKSTVCSVFETLGIPVYYADAEARKLLESPSIANALAEVFGAGIIIQGKADRKKIATLVFNDKQKLEQLNSIVHPVVKEHFASWCEQHLDYPYVIKEAAILFESGTYKQAHKIITVTAPLELKISRVMKRDTISEEEVRKRVNNQLSDDEKVKRSHYVLVNDEKQLLIPQILKIHGELTAHK
jgi:dephospho-CoA kinase